MAIYKIKRFSEVLRQKEFMNYTYARNASGKLVRTGLAINSNGSTGVSTGMTSIGNGQAGQAMNNVQNTVNTNLNNNATRMVNSQSNLQAAKDLGLNNAASKGETRLSKGLAASVNSANSTGSVSKAETYQAPSASVSSVPNTSVPAAPATTQTSSTPVTTSAYQPWAGNSNNGTGRNNVSKALKYGAIGAGLLGAGLMYGTYKAAKGVAKGVKGAAQEIDDRYHEDRRWRREERMAKRLLKHGYNPYQEGQRIGGNGFTRSYDR